MGPRALSFHARDGTRLRYLLHLPPGHVAPQPGAPQPAARHAGALQAGGWPLVLCLHGAGERGEEPAGVLVHGLARRLLDDPGFPALVLAPLCPAEATWLELAPALLELLDEAAGRLGADPARVHVTGLSMGGMGAWWLGLLAPERFASVVPVCGL
ncbi:MAG: alpha/beta hydrolase-fold protein, partial [Planctomycetia bacterium]